MVAAFYECELILGKDFGLLAFLSLDWRGGLLVNTAHGQDVMVLNLVITLRF